ncbi:hypothetical protein FRC02_004818 [Tulasnella sp. 418]|nr:hypothetical protein FRC02_004818 [Tulasnella sp. 418]
MKREAKQNAPREVVRQLKRSPSLDEPEPLFDDDKDLTSPGTESLAISDDLNTTTPPPTPSSPLRNSFFATVAAARKAWKPPQIGGLAKAKTPSTNEGPWREPQPWEIVSAVERKDVMYLMAVRDRAFHVSINLLVRAIDFPAPLNTSLPSDIHTRDGPAYVA